MIRIPNQTDTDQILHIIRGQLDVFDGPYDRAAIEEAQSACLDIGDITDGQSLVAIDPDTELVIGYGRLTGAAGSYLLTHLFVAGYTQRSGAGRRIWDTLIQGKEPCTVTVKSSPGAVDFYKKLGFYASGATHHGSPLKTLIRR